MVWKRKCLDASVSGSAVERWKAPEPGDGDSVRNTICWEIGIKRVTGKAGREGGRLTEVQN